jgi:hypothetical protein
MDTKEFQMQGSIRRELEAAERALAFVQAHPDTDPSYVAIVTRLQANVASADIHATEQRDGTAGQQAATAQRDALRAAMQAQLRHLAEVAQDALVSHPDWQASFELPKASAPLTIFITAARAMLATATAQQAVLVGLGLGTSFVDDLTQAMAAYDATGSGQATGKLTHVGARVDLKATANEGLHLLKVLDGLHRARFRNDPQLMAEWQSARNVVASPHATKSAEPVPAPPEPVPVQAVVAMPRPASAKSQAGGDDHREA